MSAPSVSSVPEPKRKSKRVLVLSIILLVLVLLFAVITAIVLLVDSQSSSDNDSTNDEDTQIIPSYVNNESTDVEQESLTQEFNGSYIQATIPADWSIVEYSDVNGMKYYAEQEGLTFSGLTGVSVLNEDDVVVFTLKGVDGIGGAGGCAEVAQFSDTESSYIQLVEDDTDMLGFGPTNVLDYTATDYSDISFLGKDFRRVENVLYVDTENSLAVFNPGCGLGGQFVALDSLGFTLSSNLDTYTAYAYEFKINSAVVDDETLSKLDDVLNSIQ